MDMRDVMRNSQDAIAGEQNEQKEQNIQLRKCRYCGGDAMMFCRDGRNFEGIPGFIATAKCKRCMVTVSGFASCRRRAEIVARDRWNGLK